jgi:hypothetical protein
MARRQKRKNVFILDEAEESDDAGSPTIIDSEEEMMVVPTPPPSPPPTPPRDKGKARVPSSPPPPQGRAKRAHRAKRAAQGAESRSWRMDGKHFCLTYPQCSVSKADALQKILESVPEDKRVEEFEGICVAEELHEDGSPHLHILICYNNKKTIRKKDHFDFITGKHGNYQTSKRGAGGRFGWLKYITKFDKQPAVFQMDVKSLLLKRKGSGAFNEVVNHLKVTQDLASVDTDLLPCVALHLQKFQNFVTWYGTTLHRPQKWPGDLYLEGPADLTERHFGLFEIVQWLNTNIGVTDRPRKTPQLYIKAPSNFHKTWLIDFLSKYQRIYRVCLDEAFYDGYQDSLYDLMVFDEWKGQRPMTHMNMLLEGTEMRLRVKGSQVVKKKNLPVIILSNYAPGIEYWKTAEERLDTFKNRLIFVVPEEPLDITLLKFHVDDTTVSPPQPSSSHNSDDDTDTDIPWE